MPSRAVEHQRFLNSYLKAFAAADVAALEQFAAEHLSREEHHGMTAQQVAQFELGFREMLGGRLELVQVEKNSETELVAVAQHPGEFPLFARMVWKFDPTHPESILHRDVQPIDPPAGALGPPLPPDQLAKEIDARLTRMAAADQFSGAVMIARDGQPLWQKAYGYADREAKIPNTVETRFLLGSMNNRCCSQRRPRRRQEALILIAQVQQDCSPFGS